MLVPTRQRAAAVRLAVAARKHATQRVWRTPSVLSVSAWLARGAIEAGLPRVLSPHEEWLLWRDIAATWCVERADLSADALADALQRAAALVADYRISEAAIADDVALESQWLAEGIVELRRRAAAQDAMASFDVAARLVTAGWAPAQRPLIVGVEISPALHALGLSVEGVPSGAAATPRLHAADDPAGEYADIASWSAAWLTRDPSARLLVIVPPGAAVRHALERSLRERLQPRVLAGESGVAVHAFEGGQPLADAAEVAAALDLLQCLSRPTERTQIARMFEAAYWPDATSARNRVADELRRGSIVRIDSGDIVRTLQAAAGESGDFAALTASLARLAAAHEALHRDAPPSLRIAAALAAAGWDAGGRDDSAAQQARAAFARLLESLPAVLGTRGRGTRESVIELVDVLTALARREYFAPSLGDVAVTVTSSLDHPVALYDGIWFASLQTDRWPEPARLDPFVPWPLQRSAGVAAANPVARLAAARDFMRVLRQSATDVVYSWQRADGETTLAPSVLLTIDEPRPRALSDAPHLAQSLRAQQPLHFERCVDERGLAWAASTPLSGGSRALERQNACPFQSYVRTRLAREPRESWEPGVSALERGRLLHGVLENFWPSIGGSADLARLDPAELQRKLDAALESVRLGSASVRDPLAARALLRERARLGSLILGCMSAELARGAFTVAAVERVRELTIAGISLSLRIDRIDRLDDGRYVVIDYKSSQNKKLDFSGERADAVQLFTYALALEQGGEQVAGFGNLHYSERHPGYRAVAAQDGIFGAREDVGDWEEFRAQYTAHLQRLAHALAQGEAAVDPLKKACEHCELTALCRRLESVPLEASDDEDAEEFE